MTRILIEDRGRHLQLGEGGAEALLDYFTRMQLVNDGFYFQMDLDGESKLRNVFWADARSRASYEDFGDIVTFDTTYLTNKYGMPFAPFVGVNHHGQSILFGQDYYQFDGIKSTLRKCVYDSQTHGEFEESWKTLLVTYNLEDNDWLRGLYNERASWIPSYLKWVFWAGMTTTQRSESMNAFFDGYVHPTTTLKQFVDQYDSALRKKVENERIADFNSFNTTIQCVTIFQFEKKFQECYTNAKFKEVQEELKGRMYCTPYLLSRKALAVTNVDNYMEAKRYVHMLIDKFSGSSYKPSPPSQALVGASSTCNESMDGVKNNKIGSPLTVRGKGNVAYLDLRVTCGIQR
ncbi:protein FAR-RED IMPAIRED RESPONSE 1-like [Corylus avellana]|uniref:protein FAR-RED IMPAIRED RESPONSE 1-like n=1 Tax=Corylus avellana TaxID=13451 RepID=UPI00286B69C3|nr:protein FAR-RED IMPAIRED RESPONSE 1-like [Corylus avellana]